MRMNCRSRPTWSSSRWLASAESQRATVASISAPPRARIGSQPRPRSARRCRRPALSASHPRRVGSPSRLQSSCDGRDERRRRILQGGGQAGTRLGHEARDGIAGLVAREDPIAYGVETDGERGVGLQVGREPYEPGDQRLSDLVLRILRHLVEDALDDLRGHGRR